MTEFDLIDWLRGKGAVAAADVRAGLGINPSKLSRLIAKVPDRVLRLGRGPATRYATPRTIAGIPRTLPVYRVDADGRPTEVASLTAFDDRGSWLQVRSGDGFAFAGLPPVVADMAPAGYLGRAFSERHADLDLPARLQDWNDDHRLIALARRGEDCPGDLIVGAESFERFAESEIVETSPTDYPRLAEESARGGAGSSAAGEQPKFTALTEGAHWIVKFTPGDGSPSDARWRDLLVCEAVALDTLREHGLPASQARVIDEGTRRFLAVVRFDRVGVRGRRGVVTLGPLDDDLFGRRDGWSAAAARLQERGLLDADDRRRIMLLEAFGRWIANGDMHFGNLGFLTEDLCAHPRLTLAPTYDMLPMDAAPRAGTLPELTAEPPRMRAALLDVWDEAANLARGYWTAVADDSRISEPFREMAAEQARRATQ